MGKSSHLNCLKQNELDKKNRRSIKLEEQSICISGEKKKSAWNPRAKVDTICQLCLFSAQWLEIMVMLGDYPAW
jgi:thymidylate kinase